MATDIKKLAEELVNMTVLEVNELKTVLKDEYGIWVNPNGGDLTHKMFRVGHIGDLTVKDNGKLIEAFKDLEKRGIIK